jgi:hypothetical protein
MVDVPVDVEGGWRIAILRPHSTISTTAQIRAAKNNSRTNSVTMECKEASGPFKVLDRLWSVGFGH